MHDPGRTFGRKGQRGAGGAPPRPRPRNASHAAGARRQLPADDEECCDYCNATITPLVLELLKAICFFRTMCLVRQWLHISAITGSGISSYSLANFQLRGGLFLILGVMVQIVQLTAQELRVLGIQHSSLSESNELDDAFRSRDLIETAVGE
jgi:hypothetical protein